MRQNSDMSVAFTLTATKFSRRKPPQVKKITGVHRDEDPAIIIDEWNEKTRN